MHVNIPNIDQHIWNSADIAIKIVHALQQQGTVRIVMDGEGPDLQELGLYAMLDQICAEFGFDPDQIRIETWNQTHEPGPYPTTIYPPLYIDSGQQFARDFELQPKQFDRALGIFIGRSNWQRLLIAGSLYRDHRDQLSITFHYDPASEYHKNHLGYEQLCHRIGTQPAQAVTQHLLARTPIHAEAVDQYPIITPAHFAISKLYPDFFAEVVCETYCAGQTFYPTEKIWRPIINLTPFVVQGPQHYLQNLRRLGFRTFDTWWSEGYDEDPWDCKHTEILGIADHLATISDSERRSMYNDMLPTLEHNRQVFLNLRERDFKTVFGYE